VSYAEAKVVLDAQPGALPSGLRGIDEAKWNAWIRAEDKTIRARLEQGELDSMANLLLFGTSFTTEPRIKVEGIGQASRDGVLRKRVDDLVAGLRHPGSNERLLYGSSLLKAQGIDPAGTGPEAGAFLYKNLLRVLEERGKLAERAAEAQRQDASGLDRGSLFRDRGVSIDTGIFPNFSVEQTLKDLKTRGLLKEGQVARVAVIGPGLDFSDKNEESSFDYYPQQTLQPFALYDSLLRTGLAKDRHLSISVFDISPRVVSHVQSARERARKKNGYTLQLPRDVVRQWPPDLIAYWRALGDQVGSPVEAIRPPELLRGLETRAVRIRPEVVLALEPLDLNIVLERRNPSAAERVDLIVATNIFLYYDSFEQMLALENAGALLKSGGLLLTNDRLPDVPGGSMRRIGMTDVRYDEYGAGARDPVGWYQKR
jgi:hypothetical protein